MPTTIESIWCDDIRNEVGGKISLMGVYQAELIVPHELAIPKLCCYVLLKSPITEPPRSVSIKIMKNDQEEILRTDLPEPPKLEDALASNPDAKFYHISAALLISPFNIERSISILRAVAVIDGVEISGGGLAIKIQQ